MSLSMERPIRSGKGAYRQKNTVSHKILLLSQPLTVPCLFKNVL